MLEETKILINNIECKNRVCKNCKYFVPKSGTELSECSHPGNTQPDEVIEEGIWFQIKNPDEQGCNYFSEKHN